MWCPGAGRTTGCTFLPGVSKENSGGGLVGLDGVEVSGSNSPEANSRGGREEEEERAA